MYGELLSHWYSSTPLVPVFVLRTQYAYTFGDLLLLRISESSMHHATAREANENAVIRIVCIPHVFGTQMLYCQDDVGST